MDKPHAGLPGSGIDALRARKKRFAIVIDRRNAERVKEDLTANPASQPITAIILLPFSNG